MPKKILFLSNAATLYGAERALLTLLRNLDRKKFIPVVVVPEQGPLKDELERLGIETRIQPLIWWTHYPPPADPWREPFRKRCEKLSELIENENIDVVHTNTTVIAEGAIAALYAGRPHVWHLHEIMETHSEIKLLLPLPEAYRLIGLLSDAVVVVSKTLESSVKKFITPNTIKVIPNGIEDKKEWAGFFIRKELGIGADSLLVSAIGPVLKIKGYEDFIDAANLALKKNRNIFFIVIGSIEDRRLARLLSGKIKSAGTGDNIKFLGYRMDARKILDEVDIHVVPSLSESFSLAAVEAMAAGKPVISTRCGGPEEFVEDGKNGLLVPVNRPQALAEAMLYLSERPELRAAMGEKGKGFFQKRFTVKAFTHEFESLYQSLGCRKKLDRQEQDELNGYIEKVFSAQDSKPRPFLNHYLHKALSMLKKSGAKQEK